MADENTTVAQLRARMASFVADRQWELFHNPKNLAMSLAIETAELMEHFQWLTLEQAQAYANEEANREAIADELADCLSYVLALANALEMDLSEELRRKMIKNERKYPSG